VLVGLAGNPDMEFVRPENTAINTGRTSRAGFGVVVPSAHC
jgi:hypothetical protein